jgi:hypothetical protein
MRISSLIAWLCLSSWLAVASPLPEFPFVYVRGEAARSLAPDKALITFDITSYHTNAADAYRQQAESADQALAFTQQLGVPADAITAQAIEKRSVRREDEKDNELEIIGYETERTVKIEVSDLALFPKLIEFLYTQPRIEEISVVFGRKDETAILKGLTEDACANAKENAERLTTGFQKRVKRVRAISESGFSGLGQPFGLYEDGSGFAAYRMTSERQDFRVIPSTISFRKTVYAIFEIK